MSKNNTLHIRPAQPAELAALNDLCVRSKASWGYAAAFMELCKDELKFSPEDLAETDVAVAVRDGRPVGVAQVKFADQDAELHMLFIEPDAMGTGAGKVLFTWACTVARDGGADALVIDSDPYAAPFYRRMGARDIGLAPSASIPGRMLPMLSYALTEEAT